MKLFFGFALAMAIATTSDAAPKGVFYDCDIKPTRREVNWIADKVGFVWLKDGSVKVVDPYILHFMKQPTTAQVRAKGSDVVRISWLLKNITTDIGTTMAPTRYSAELNTKTKTVSMRVSSTVFSGSTFRAKGTCRILKGKPKFKRQ